MDLIKTGLTDITKEQLNLVIFPNPSNGRFRLRCENCLSGNYKVQIINELGQIQLENEVYIVESIHEEEFELSYLPKGNYFVKVFDRRSTRTEKVLLK